MIDAKSLLAVLKDDPSWRRLIDKLHDDAGLDAYDHTLIVEAAEELAWALGEEIFELTLSGMRRHMIVERWQEKNATAATVA